MEHNLKKSLEMIKARAQRLRKRTDRAPVDESAAPPTPPASGGTDTGPAAGSPPGGEPVLDAYKTGEPGPIEQIVPGRALEFDGQPFYLITSAGPDVDPDAPGAADFFGRLTAWPGRVDARLIEPGRRRGVVSPRPPARPFDPGKICFLDIETTGLSPNTYLFLCGLMFLRDNDFVVEQVFARDYAEEVGVLGYVREKLAGFDAVVTYNGAKFDLPFISTRMAVNLLPAAGPIYSVDLLYATRRVFRGVLPDNKLGTLERHLRGTDRTGDIPGRHIPDAYHDFVSTGDGRAMKNVLYHNRMDLFTMAVFVNYLASDSAP